MRLPHTTPFPSETIKPLIGNRSLIRRELIINDLSPIHLKLN